ncbi:MAG: M20/M25/M40 family metallo-hydrolase, partial [Bacillales bacterium]|nr:M20/M25/M40 family metallo-hydrolase [Bacillales bacterium]MDY5920653.1 M20/M25/M40 family metallo-hydrolase [Candidatus Enteromonas sp.]
LSAFSFLGSYYHIDFLSNLAKALSDPNGKSFGGDSLSPELGESTFNYGIVSYESNRKNLSISVDYRYGEKADPEAALNALQDASKMDVHCEGFVAPLLYDKKSPLVSTLMKSYRHMTHRFFDKPMAIGGGTYAKEAKNCVAYGSAFKGHPGDIHSPNEYIYIEDFLKQIPIYADAIASLGKVASK